MAVIPKLKVLNPLIILRFCVRQNKGSEPYIMIPSHTELNIGTMSGILNDIAFFIAITFL